MSDMVEIDIDFDYCGEVEMILAHDECGEHEDVEFYRNDLLASDNAKLRELGATMLKCIMANERKALICWECPAHKQFDELRWFCCIKHDAAELGIEVPS